VCRQDGREEAVEGTLEAARRQLTMLRDFVQKNNVASIPGDQQALVAEAPPYNRENAAFIQVPGPYETGVTATYNIAPPNPKWTKAEQAEYIPSEATLLFTSAHEVWPATSCSSCTRTPIQTSSRGSGWGTRSRRAGRTTQRR